MKKNILSVIALLGLVVLISGCRNQQNDTKESSETNVSNTSESMQSTSKEAAQQSIFAAILSEDAKKNEGNDNSMRLVLTEVKAEQDPENIVNMMKNDGVILNVVPEQLKTGVTMEQLTKGQQVRFTLTGMPAMTMSIPPQVMGQAVKQVSLVD